MRAMPLPEKILISQAVILIILLCGGAFLGVQLNAAYETNACHVTASAKLLATEQVRAALGNEGRAAASALASTVVSAAAASPGSVRIGLIGSAEKVYAAAMSSVNAGLARNPVTAPAAC